MNIGITGGSGFIGRAVRTEAEGRGDKTVIFSRKEGPERRLFSHSTSADVSGLDGIVHLAGESILGIWTGEKRRRILESRVEGTRRLVEGIASSSAAERPRVLVCASAIGWYGDTGDRAVDERAPSGSGFLAEVTRAWEAEAVKAEALGVRVVRVRTGMVLGRDGGAMKLILPVFRLGLGGRLGSGRQWMSCIDVRDHAGIILDCLHDGSWSGAVNSVMPKPVTNAEFTREVARAVRRPAPFPVPAFVLRLALGELSHLLLDSQRILPGVLGEKGYRHRFPDVASALAGTVD